MCTDPRGWRDVETCISDTRRYLYIYIYIKCAFVAVLIFERKIFRRISGPKYEKGE